MSCEVLTPKVKKQEISFHAQFDTDTDSSNSVRTRGQVTHVYSVLIVGICFM